MFFKKKQQHPIQRHIYAVTAGYYLGELLVYIETMDNVFKFLSLPTMVVREIPCDKFNFGIEEKIIDVVEKMPKNVFNVCKLQYDKNTEQITA